MSTHTAQDPIVTVPGTPPGPTSGGLGHAVLAARNRCQTLTIEALRGLSSRPAALFVVLWAVNAMSAPYATFSHDAKLYGMLVLNRISEGRFSDDLFLRFGSQDQYAPFSRVVAPVARLLGVEWTFLLLFLVFNALLVFVMQRLVNALIDDPALATLALLVMVIVPLPYGGLRVFHVREAFFTPRVIGCAIGLLALEQILRIRYVRGLMLALAATLAHPLIGSGVLMIWGGCAVFEFLSNRAVWWVLAGGGGLALLILGYYPLGVTIFGSMDAEWLAVVRSASAYNFPLEWKVGDWLNVFVSLAVAVCAAVLSRGEASGRARFLFVAAGVGAIGVMVAVVAAQAPYRFLLQGQPYRALWILAALQVPLAFWVAARAWRHGLAGRCLAVTLAGFFAVSDYLPLEIIVLLIAFPLLVLVQRGVGPTPRHSDWVVRSLGGSLIVGAVAWGLMKGVFAVVMGPELLARITPIEYGWLVTRTLGPVFWLGATLVFLSLLVRPAPGRALVPGMLSLVVIVHMGGSALTHVPRYRVSAEPHGRDLAFVQRYLEQRNPTGAVLTVYAPYWDRVDYLWFVLRVKSYYSLTQVVGVIFSRQTAIEARRRGDVVRPFELDRYRATSQFLSYSVKAMVDRLFRPELGMSPPTTADLSRLCRPDEAVDVVVLQQDFDGLFSASNGRVFIYECARIRTAARGVADQGGPSDA
jgi:hypothetical protein